jgi:hypothetical protein
VFDVFIGYAVVHLVDRYVIIELYGGDFPGGAFVRGRRQRQERMFLLIKKRAQPATGSFLKWSFIERRQLLGNGCVQLRQGKERLLTQSGQNPGGDYADRAFDTGLVLRFADAGRDDRRAIMLRHFVVRLVDHRGIPG